MSATTSQGMITIGLTELENLIRRVIREEFIWLFRKSRPSILDDWSHEGPTDPAGDEALLNDALVVLEQHENNPDAWMNWEDFKAELARAEAAGELPD